MKAGARHRLRLPALARLLLPGVLAALLFLLLPSVPVFAQAPAAGADTLSPAPLPGPPPSLAAQRAADTLASPQPVGRTSTASESAAAAAGAPAGAAPAHLHGLRRWYFVDRTNLLIILLIVGGAIFFYTVRATRGVTYSIRRIAGIDAIEEAVGRATEMGKPVLFVPGIQDLDNVQTVAGITILASVAGRIAEYDAHLEVPTSRSLVMTTARETVKEAFSAAGRPDAYNDDMVYYVTDEQFGYVAYLDGYMVRNEPATCIYMGAFFAESLILAETGYSVGAIQIAGTAMPTQLPFFVAACDYTLIGEELFAASAYLSQDPRLLGSLRGQDFGKIFAMFFIAVGTLLVTVEAVTGGGFHALAGWLVNVAFGTKG